MNICPLQSTIIWWNRVETSHFPKQSARERYVHKVLLSLFLLQLPLLT